jgi:hypothetical protein
MLVAKRFKTLQELNISDVSCSNLTMKQLMLDRIEQIKKLKTDLVNH